MKRIGHNSKVGCVLNVDMKPEVPWDRSVYGHTLTNHGSTWNLDGRYFDGTNYIYIGDTGLTNNWKVNVKMKSLINTPPIQYPLGFQGKMGLFVMYTSDKWGIYDSFEVLFGNILKLNQTYSLSVIKKELVYTLFVNNNIVNTNNLSDINISECYIGRRETDGFHLTGFIKNVQLFKI